MPVKRSRSRKYKRSRKVSRTRRKSRRTRRRTRRTRRTRTRRTRRIRGGSDVGGSDVGEGTYQDWMDELGVYEQEDDNAAVPDSEALPILLSRWQSSDIVPTDVIYAPDPEGTEAGTGKGGGQWNVTSSATPLPVASVATPLPVASVAAPLPVVSFAAPPPVASFAAPPPVASVAAPPPVASFAAPSPVVMTDDMEEFIMSLSGEQIRQALKMRKHYKKDKLQELARANPKLIRKAMDRLEKREAAKKKDRRGKK
jgi:hypothetical protein